MRRYYDPLIDLPNLCIHHWLCEDQDHLVVHAVCEKCDARAEFKEELCFGYHIRECASIHRSESCGQLFGWPSACLIRHTNCLVTPPPDGLKSHKAPLS
jgi:hypothetical protein